MDAVAAAREQGINPRADPVAFNQAISDAQAAVDAQIQSTLGDAGFAQYQQYVQTMPERNTVAQVQQSLSYTGTPLTNDQQNQLVSVLAQYAPTGGGNGTAGTAAGIGALMNATNRTSPITQDAISAAISSGAVPPEDAPVLQQVSQTIQAANEAQRLMRQGGGATSPSGGLIRGPPTAY